jgi:hypothetical protein
MATNSFDITVALNPLGGLGVRFIGDDSNSGNPELTVAGYKVWHAGNDGAASGLEADLLDGYHASAFALLSGASFTGTITNTGAYRSSDGSAAVPSISFSADTDTGLFRIGADTLGFSAGGAERARITTSGMQVTGTITGTAVIQNATDTTSGRLLRLVGNTGAFGLGGIYAPLLPDLDSTSIPAGFHQFNTTGGTSGTPPPGFQVGGILVLSGTGSGTQTPLVIAVQRSSGSGRVAWRTSQGGTWGPWQTAYSTANVVGTVSQSGGVPTGAAFERNANGNGRWWKTADGMMQVARDDYLVAPVSTALGGIYRSATVTWTFPQAFAAPPIVTGQVADPDCWISVVATTTTQVTFRVLSATSRSSVRVNISAIGRWFSVGAATPHALFQVSERGFWFEFSDFSKLWQDSARTIPVTAIGDPVGSVADISGNGHYAVQATSGRRPTLQVDDQGRAYLQFDGVDDGLSVTTLNLNADSAFTLFAAVRKDTDANIARIVEYSPGVATNPGFLLQQPTAGTNFIQGMHRGATTSQTSTRSGIDAPATFVATVISDLAAPNVQLRVNGTPSTANTGATGGGTYGNQTMFIGSRNNTTTYFTGRIYALVGRAGTTSAEDIVGIETYLNERCGAW